MCLWIFNVTDRCSASVQVTHKLIISSSLLVIAWNKHERTSEGILFQPRKVFQVQVHRRWSTLLSGLFVGQKWQILQYDWLDRLSIKLPEKGQNEKVKIQSVKKLILCFM